MSVAEKVKEYVEKRPYIQEALKKDIVNYSALARKIQDNVEGSFEAIKMALRRHSESIKKERIEQEKNILKILSKTNIELKSNVKICKSSKKQTSDIYAKTKHGYTLVQEENKNCDGETVKDQVLITLKSPKELENTSGVISYILSLLDGRGINVTEFISCREDTHIIIDEKDATKVFKLLNEEI